MSKYDRLWEHISRMNEDKLVMSYEEIKNVLGFEINHSFLSYKKELLEYGYKVLKISMKDKKIEFVRCEE